MLLLLLLLAPFAYAQTSLGVSSPSVNLSGAEVRTVNVTASREGRVEYKVEGKPAWLRASSSNNFNAPDTLSFQIANSNCGTCSATLTFLPVEGGTPATVTVTFAPETGVQLTVSPGTILLNNAQARSTSVKASRGLTIPYKLSTAPAWLTVTSANEFKTPDTLSFQIANANCGDCTAALTLTPEGGKPVTLTVTYNVAAAVSYRIEPQTISLAFPAGAGAGCGSGYFSSCAATITSTNPSVTTYSAKVAYAQGGNWLTLNNSGGLVTAVPLSTGLNLSVNPNVASTLASGAYSGQVMLFNPANQTELLMINVSLLVNPGKMSIMPSSGSGNAQTFTMQFPHPGGWEHIAVANLMVNDSLEAKRSCYLAYVVPSRTLLLLDDAGGDTGPDGPKKNSQCAAQLVSANGEGDTLTVAVKLTFTASFAGKKNLFMASRDAQSNTGWQAIGSWEVRAPSVRRTPSKSPAKKKTKE